MNKIKALAWVMVAMLAASSAFAAEKACCATTTASNHGGKDACAATFANLNLTAAQKSKMEKLAMECDKGGCNKNSMARMEKRAKGVLNKEQFAAWKSQCAGMMSEKARS